MNEINNLPKKNKINKPKKKNKKNKPGKKAPDKTRLSLGSRIS